MADLGLKCTKNRFRQGLHPRSRWASLQRSPRPLSWIWGPTSKGSRRKGREGEGKGAEGKGRRGEGKGRREERERERGGRLLFQTPLNRRHVEHSASDEFYSNTSERHVSLRRVINFCHECNETD